MATDLPSLNSKKKKMLNRNDTFDMNKSRFAFE